MHETGRIKAVMQPDYLAELMDEDGGQPVAPIDPKRPRPPRVEFDDSLDEATMARSTPPATGSVAEHTAAFGA